MCFLIQKTKIKNNKLYLFTHPTNKQHTRTIFLIWMTHTTQPSSSYLIVFVFVLSHHVHLHLLLNPCFFAILLHKSCDRCSQRIYVVPQIVVPNDASVFLLVVGVQNDPHIIDDINPISL